jgi:hypothetical protein
MIGDYTRNGYIGIYDERWFYINYTIIYIKSWVLRTNIFYYIKKLKYHFV